MSEFHDWQKVFLCIARSANYCYRQGVITLFARVLNSRFPGKNV